MDKFVADILKRIQFSSRRLYIVTNIDHFLWNSTVQKSISEESGLLFVMGDEFELRIHFELEYKKCKEQKYCYLCEDKKKILADIRRESVETDFLVKDMFYGYESSALIGLEYNVLQFLYLNQPNVQLSSSETIMAIAEATESYGNANWNGNLRGINLNWSNPLKCMNEVVAVMLEAIKRDGWGTIESEINRINESFQAYLGENYFSNIKPSTYLLRPKMVTKILPYINSKYIDSEKIALIVIDGMSYWQYGIFRNYLNREGIQTKDDVIYSWIPSITKLSRQAIFRGKEPEDDYVQNPNNERKLWFKYWGERNYETSEVMYIYDDCNVEINNGVKRLAYVDVALDKKMHASSSYKDLYDLTDNWCLKKVEFVKRLKNEGFRIFITTDHGNILAKGWHDLKTEEKTYLYQNESRGTRHLIYNNRQGYEIFKKEHQEELCNMMVHSNWIVWKTDRCFQSKPKNFTHGGAHFLEVLIPFITIE